MGFLHWVNGSWFELVQTVGIIAGLVYPAAIYRADAKSRRSDNLIKLTAQHRELWDELEQRPSLKRILETNVDLRKDPVTPEEERYIGKHILRLNSAFHAIEDGVFAEPEGLVKDVRRFFSRPIAKVVWKRMKPMQDAALVKFVDGCLDEEKSFEASG